MEYGIMLALSSTLRICFPTLIFLLWSETVRARHPTIGGPESELTTLQRENTANDSISFHAFPCPNIYRSLHKAASYVYIHYFLSPSPSLCLCLCLFLVFPFLFLFLSFSFSLSLSSVVREVRRNGDRGRFVMPNSDFSISDEGLTVTLPFRSPVGSSSDFKC